VFSPLDWKPRPHPVDVAEVLGLGFGAWVKHSPPKRLRNASAVAASGKQNRNIGLLCLVPTPAAADWDAPFTVEGVKFWENTAKASRRKCEFDQMREVPFVRKADDLALATSHLAQSYLKARRDAHAT